MLPNIIALIILFSSTNAWSKDWFVLPEGKAQGSNDGTSYVDAWDGLLSVKWGAGGVSPGDNLYVCGLHVYDIEDKYSYSKKGIDIISGESEDKRINIRGDCLSNDGVIWGAGRLVYDEWNDEGGGVWSIKLIGGIWGGDWIFQDIGVPVSDSHIVLHKAESIDDLRKIRGSHYSKDYKKESKLYVHSIDNKSPAGRIYVNWWGYNFNIKKLSYVTFKNITLYNPGRIERSAKLSHVNWVNCKMSYGMHSLLTFVGENDHIKVINCELSWAGNGIYNIQQDWQTKDEINKTTNNYVYKDNHIHHIGVRKVNHNQDAHAIGIQGGRNGLVDGNVIEYSGSGIVLYAYTEQVLTKSIIRNNFVKNLHTLGGATGYGIATASNNDSLSDKNDNKFYNNIIINSPVGLRFQFEDAQQIYNNVIYHCGIGIESARNYNGIGAHLKFYNNIVYNSEKYHVYLKTGSKDINMYFDHNIYYPTNEKLFFVKNNGFYFNDWRHLSTRYGKPDINSIIQDPLFSNRSGSFSHLTDFMLTNKSPAIDQGLLVERYKDIIGNKINKLPDIGAFEYQY